MMRSIVKLTLSATLAISSFALAASAGAQEFPSQPITIILSSGAGSSVDAMARTLASAAERELGQPVIVSNRPGGDGAVAMADLLRAPADGYTLWGATKTFPVSMNTTLAGMFTMEDFQPLVRVQIDPFALVVQNDAPWETLEDFLEDARENLVNVGGFGSASPHGLFNFFLAKESDAGLSWIPFNAGSDAITALMGGHVDAVLTNPSSMMPQVNAGILRVLAVATEERSSDLADIPTFREYGYDLVDAQWRGLFLKAGTPDDVVEKLDAAFRAAIASDDFQQYLVNTVQADGYMGPAEFEAYVSEELEAVTAVAEEFQTYVQ